MRSTGTIAQGEYRHLLAAHRQHHAVADAIRRRDPAGAEAIMREHATIAIARSGVFERLGIEAATLAGM